jgi:EAL domain-containing protein (putative c-di-GMP-specific phosphodiesterase class I)
MIVQLGRAVATAACRESSAWRSMPGWEDLKLNVNVSVRQAVEPGFAAMIREALEASGLAPSALVLEITESLMLHESIVTDGSLRQLREAGVGLVVDDFWTGFSALDYFKRFAVQGLKIDRSFIGGLGTSREDTAIVSATLAFGSTLGLAVTAEGVETADQADRLRGLGCAFAQGYLFGRPMPAESIPAFLATAAARQAPASSSRVA